MPATFAHFTLFYEALAGLTGHDQLRIALKKYSQFGLLGTNSPDFPIVVCNKLWEDLLHGPTAGNVIPPAISLLRSLSGPKLQKCLAWFCGYLSHMVGDTTIHPMVNLRVGPYVGNEIAHQTCEVHQDAYIFTRLNLDEITKCEFIKTVIGSTCASHNRLALDSDILSFWESLTSLVFPNEEMPNFHWWYDGYTEVVDNLAEEGIWRHVRSGANKLGKAHLLQIAPDQVDKEAYISSLPLPFNQRASYDQIFSKAITNTVAIWCAFDDVVFSGAQLASPLVGPWNLNTGKINNSEFLFW